MTGYDDLHPQRSDRSAGDHGGRGRTARRISRGCSSHRARRWRRSRRPFASSKARRDQAEGGLARELRRRVVAGRRRERQSPPRRSRSTSRAPASEFAAAHDPGATRAEKARRGRGVPARDDRAGCRAHSRREAASGFLRGARPQKASRHGSASSQEAHRGRIARDRRRGNVATSAARPQPTPRRTSRAPAGSDPRSACDAITLNPLLGTDSDRAFLASRARARALDSSCSSARPTLERGVPRSRHAHASERTAAAVERWGELLRGRQGWSSVGAWGDRRDASRRARASARHHPPACADPLARLRCARRERDRTSCPRSVVSTAGSSTLARHPLREAFELNANPGRTRARALREMVREIRAALGVAAVSELAIRLEHLPADVLGPAIRSHAALAEGPVSRRSRFRAYAARESRSARNGIPSGGARRARARLARGLASCSSRIRA